MSRTASNMLALGTRAPDFRLPDTDGRVVSSADFAHARGLLVMFICNHCPFVKHVQEQLAALGRDYGQGGIALVAISSNDADAYPDDGPERMAEVKESAGFGFPYLYDEAQDLARAFQAACTPDFYLFDRTRRLVYRGQLDDSRPSNGVPVTGRDLRAALDAVLSGTPVNPEQKPSLGCNIKWRQRIPELRVPRSLPQQPS